jgi:uncharacterized protein YecE (DUF72 family)
LGSAPAGIYVGTSGWYYDHWEGVLYPPKLPKHKRFGVYAERYNAVEINATYYRLPRPSTVEGWYGKAPRGFAYVAKASKQITHEQKLRGAEPQVKRLLDSLAGLREKLACVLFQLPPSLHRDTALLGDFLACLPARPAAAFEFRHASWECDEVYETLAAGGASHVVVGRRKLPFADVHTAAPAYYRLHGPEAVCSSSYTEEWLAAHARRLEILATRGMTSFTFFNNDIGGHAVRNADAVNALLTEMRGRLQNG